MAKTNKDFMNRQMGRYLKIPTVKEDQQLFEAVNRYIKQGKVKSQDRQDKPKQQIKQQKPLSQNKSAFQEIKNSNQQINIKNKKDVVNQKESANGVKIQNNSKTPSGQVIVQKPIKQEEVKQFRYLLINKDIIQLIQKNSLILLGTQSNKQQTSVICGFMDVETLFFTKEQIGDTHQAFKTEERKIVGIGLKVERDFINQQHLNLVHTFVPESGVLVIVNTTNKKKYLFKLNSKFKPTQVNSQINILDRSQFLELEAKEKGFDELIDTTQNVRTKHVQTKPLKSFGGHAMTDPENNNNIKSTFDYTFSQKLYLKAGRGPTNYWGFILFPENDSIYKYKITNTIEDMQLAMKSKTTDIIPVERFGHPANYVSRAFLDSIWENKIQFFGVSNKKHFICFFMLIDDPKNQAKLEMKQLENNNSKCIKFLFNYGKIADQRENKELKGQEIKDS